jgi:FkbM family methyltransferase
MDLMKKYKKEVLILKKFKIHYIWRFILKCYEVRWIPKYLSVLGVKQYFLLKFSSKKISKITLKNYKNPLFIRNKTSDFDVFKQIFIKEEYNYKYNFFPKYILDAGSNCGFSIVYFANRFPGVNIIGVEPESSNFEMIKKNTINYPNIHLVFGGVWDKNSDLCITNLEKDRHWSFRVDEVKKGKGDFKGYSIQELMKMFKFEEIDIFKMDIEGSEKKVFEKNYKFWLPKVKLGFLELHEKYAPGVEKVVINRLKEYKFKKSSLGENLVFYK